MRRSYSTGGAAPQRIRNDLDPQSRRLSSSQRLSTGSRNSFGLSNNALTMSVKSHVNNPVTSTAKKRRVTSRFYSMSDVRQDPRPITERPFKEKAIKNLILFLGQYGYPNPCSPKMLHSPPTKEFIRIFEFMFSILEPGFKCTGRIEEQFPHIMKELGYPFNISKAAMSAIGSPHTWPHLLAALDWLREQILLYLNQDVDELLFPPATKEEFDGVSLAKVLFDYCKNTYIQFLDGADTFEELDSNLAKEISKNSAGGDVEALVHENKRLKEELDMLEKEPDPLIAQKDKLALQKMDYEKLVKYHQDLDIHISQKKATVKSLTEEKKAMEAELAVIKADNEKKQQILSTQMFSQADVERINMERHSLKDRIECLEAENGEIQSCSWELERKIGKDQITVSKKLKEYNQKARLLHLIPLSEQDARGINFEMHLSLDEASGNYFKTVLKPALNQLRNEAMDKLNELQEQQIKAQTVLDQLLDLIVDKQEVIKSLEDKLQDTAEKLERHKKALQQELSSIQLEIDSIQNQLKELHNENGPDIRCLKTRLLNEERKLKQLRDEKQQKVKRFHDFMSEVAKLVVDHKMEIQDHVRQLAKDAKQRLQQEKQINILDLDLQV